MSDTALQLALREVIHILRNPAYWAVSAAVAVVLGLSGPFGTYETLQPGARLAYWAAIVLTTAPTGWLIGTWVVLGFELRGWPFWIEALSAGVAVGVAVSLVVHGVTVLARGGALLSWQGLAQQWPGTPLIGVAVTCAVVWTNRRAAVTAAPPAPASVSEPAARLLARLPFERRATLVSLSVQDHYTEVTTTTGRALVLLRLSDAIAEAEGVPGLQIHRSHWVALAQVARVRRDGARAVLTLKDGRALPVSRTYLPDVKLAGLL